MPDWRPAARWAGVDVEDGGMGATLTRKGLATRQRIVAGAAELFRARGVAGTSLGDVCEATSTSKRQLFHYFPDGRTQLVDADRRAAALLAGLQGGVLIMLATGDISHLEVALDEGIGALRGGRA